MTGDTTRNVVENLACHLRMSPVQWTFKKVDSVLRGNVGVELQAIMKGLGRTRTVLAPANPSRGRIIVGGRYFVDHVPLDETEFRNDPEHPARSSWVRDLLDVSEGCPVHALEHTAYSGQETGVIVAQAETAADLSRWAEHLDEDTLAAGGADFFRAVLEQRLPPTKVVGREPLTPVRGPKLVVCGSGFTASGRALAEASDLGIAVFPMPKALSQRPWGGEVLVRPWADEIAAALSSCGCVIVTAGRPVVRCATLAADLRGTMATLVRQVLDRTCVHELFIEGGATAKAILRRMDWETLDVIGEYRPGVVRLRVKEPKGQVLTLKPGSYPWPDGLWRQCAQKA
jgi:uncharacterized protein YgbK (DUF1537 family)